jgi:hypothetical protein
MFSVTKGAIASCSTQPLTPGLSVAATGAVAGVFTLAGAGSADAGAETDAGVEGKEQTLSLSQ